MLDVFVWKCGHVILLRCFHKFELHGYNCVYVSVVKLNASKTKGNFDRFNW